MASDSSSQIAVDCELKSEIKFFTYRFRWTVENMSSLFENDISATFHPKPKQDWKAYLTAKSHQLTFSVTCDPSFEGRVHFKISIASLENALCFNHSSSFKSKQLKKRDAVLGIIGPISFVHILDMLTHDTAVIICEMNIEPSKHRTFTISEKCPAPYSRTVHCPTANNFKSFLESETYTDVVLKLRDTEIRAHKIILCANSSVFASMLSTEMEEKEANAVLIEDISTKTTNDLLDYIYTGETKPLTHEEAVDLYYAADKYQIAYLRENCANVLVSTLTKENADDIFNLSIRHSDDVLKTAVIKFLNQQYVIEQ